MSDVPPPAEVRPERGRWSNAIGPLVLGCVLLLSAGSCTVTSLPALDDPAGAALGWLAIYVCAPVAAAGLGLTVLALSRAFGSPESPPVWRRLTGWLLLAGCVAYLVLPVWNEFQGGRAADVGGLVFGVLLMAIPAGLVAWLGWILAVKAPEAR